MNDNNNNNHAISSVTDSLSDILRLFRLDVDIYHNAKICGNWSINAHTLGATCFHMVTEGHCKMEVPGHFAGVLECGDLVIFPRELAHTIVPEKTMRGKQQHLPYREALHREGTGLLCGEVRFQHRGFQYLLEALPAVFLIRNDQNKSWLNSLLALIVTESLEEEAANKVILSKLSELIFTYAIRQYAHDKPEKVGMLALYSHHRLMTAINAFHQQPALNWTLLTLAKKAGLSRTAFSETFKQVSGWTAGQYINWWRMQLAWVQLGHGDTLANVAAQVGYLSEAAFSRAFQKTFGIPAGRVRRGLITATQISAHIAKVPGIAGNPLPSGNAEKKSTHR